MTGSSGLADVFITVFIKIPTYIVISTGALLHFRGLISSIAALASGKTPSNFIIDFIRPLTRALDYVVREAFGKNQDKFEINLSNVLMVCLLVAIIALSNEIVSLREAIAAQPSRHAHESEPINSAGGSSATSERRSK